MRRILLMLILLTGIRLCAQTTAYNGFCTAGGQSAATQGLSSTNKLQQIIPSCQVTVYLTGTTTLATIYSNTTNTPLSNPFTADSLSSVAPGKWLFYAAENQGYDVMMSGGIAPLTFSSPVTLTDLIFGGGGGGGSFVAAVNGTPVITPNSLNFINSPTVTATNPSTNQVQFTVVNSGCQPSGNNGFFVQYQGGATPCVPGFIDEGATEPNTVTTTDQNITLQAEGGSDSVVDLTATGEDGIWLCTSRTGPSSECPATGSNGSIDVESGSTIGIFADGGPIDEESLTGSINLESLVGSISLLSDVGSITLEAHSATDIDDFSSSGLVLTESTNAGNIELSNTGIGNISLDSAKGISIADNSSTGIAFDEAGTGTLSEAANAIAFSALTHSAFTLNGEIVCTASNGACPGSGTAFQVNGTPLSSAATVNFQAGTNITLTNPSAGNILVTASATAATAFSAVTTATNTNHLTMGTGGIFDASGSGTIAATSAPAAGITGTTLASGVVTSSLTTLAGGLVGTAAYATLGSTGSDVPQLSSGLLLPAVLPLATTGAFGAIKPDGSSCTVAAGVLTCPGTSGISLTTTGNGGLTTLTTGVLNVPHYAGSGANSDITSLTGLTTPLSPSRGGTGSAGLTGYMFGNGTSIVTASTTIPGSAISGNIPGNAANLTAAVTVPVGTSATTATPSGSGDTRIATKADVFNAIGGGLSKICSGTITLSGTLTSGSTSSVGTATCTGLASTDIIIATFNGNIFTVGGFIPSTNGVLAVSLVPSANTITVNAENNTTLSQTIGTSPAAILNYLVIR